VLIIFLSQTIKRLETARLHILSNPLLLLATLLWLSPLSLDSVRRKRRLDASAPRPFPEAHTLSSRPI